MNRKDILLNITLVFLLILTIIQASLLWIKFPNLKEHKNTQEVYNTFDFFKEILKPEKIVLNAGNSKHYVEYTFPDIWNDYVDVLSSIFLKTHEENMIPVNIMEYLKAQREKSIVFVFNKETNGRLFLNLTGDNRNSKNKYNLEIKEIYLSSKSIFISNSKGIFKLNYKVDVNPEELIDKLDYSNLTPYINLYEAYGIKNNIYIPKDGIIKYQEIYYQDEIQNLNKVYENNLASRVLNQNIDYIKEITQNDGTTFVNGDKFLKILNAGLIYYENPELIENTEENLYLSLKTAVVFMSSKMGVPNTIKMYKYEPLNDKNIGSGYRFYFNFTQDNIPVYLDSNIASNYIIIDVYSDFIRSYRQIYRSAVEKPEKIYHESKKNDIFTLVNDNYNIFNINNENPTVEEILKSLQNVDICYIDINKNDEKSKLIPALKIEYNNRNLFFNLKNGYFIMER